VRLVEFGLGGLGSPLVGESIMTLRDKLFGFQGRLRRRDWWLLSIMLALVGLAANYLVYAILFPGADFDPKWKDPGPVRPTIFVDLLSLWPTMAITFKRAHDRSKSGWTLAVIIVAGLLFSYGGDALLERFGDVAGLAAFPLIALFVYFVVVLGFLDGTQGPNRFGPSPKGVGDAPLAAFD